MAIVATLTFSVMSFFVVDQQKTPYQISRVEFEAAVASLQEARRLFEDTIPQLQVDPKSAFALEAGLSQLVAAQDLFQGLVKKPQAAAISFVTQASAQTSQGSSDQLEFNKPMILYAILGVLVAMLVAFLGMYMFSKDAGRIDFAKTNLQTLISFMIGVVAGMLGTSGT